LGSIDTGKPLRNRAAISLGFGHKSYRELTLAGTEIPRLRSLVVLRQEILLEWDNSGQACGYLVNILLITC
jgi:hypothetical protein